MTDLDEILASLVEGVAGATAAAVGGVDGLIVDQYPNLDPDLAGAAAELTTVVTSLRRLFGDHLDAGDPHEVVLAGDALTVYVRLLDDSYFTLVLLDASGDLDAARSHSLEAGRRILAVFA